MEFDKYKLSLSRMTNEPWDNSRGHLLSDSLLCPCRVWPCTLQSWGLASLCHTWTSSQQTPQCWCQEAGLTKGERKHKIVKVREAVYYAHLTWRWKKYIATPTRHIDVCVFIFINIKPSYSHGKEKDFCKEAHTPINSSTFKKIWFTNW